MVMVKLGTAMVRMIADRDTVTISSSKVNPAWLPVQ
jgi:hypothetical protein